MYIHSYSIFCLFNCVTATTFGDRAMLGLRHFSKHTYRNYFESRDDQFFSVPIMCAIFPLSFQKFQEKWASAKKIGRKKHLIILRASWDLVWSSRAVVLKVVYKLLWYFFFSSLYESPRGLSLLWLLKCHLSRYLSSNQQVELTLF